LNALEPAKEPVTVLPLSTNLLVTEPDKVTLLISNASTLFSVTVTLVVLS
jgi:hypothetical protein